MQDLNSRLTGCKFFSKLDLVQGYHQVPVTAADVPKMAIITPFRLFEYLYIPFGLKNDSQSFHRLMDCTFADQPNIFAYLDDNLATTASIEKHLQVLHQVFQLLKDNSLVLNLEKCEYLQESISFLGHKVHAGGVELLTVQCPSGCQPQCVTTIEPQGAPIVLRHDQLLLQVPSSCSLHPLPSHNGSQGKP